MKHWQQFFGVSHQDSSGPFLEVLSRVELEDLFFFSKKEVHLTMAIFPVPTGERVGFSPFSKVLRQICMLTRAFTTSNILPK